MSRSVPIYLAWTVIIAAAIFLRSTDLSYRPMHFDEATGARIAARELESGKYIYNPTHFHGPTLSFFTNQLLRFTDQDSWKKLQVSSLRTITAVAGVLTVLVPILLIRWLGMGPALASAALLATSPLLVYYSRMYIHETLLGLFGLLTLVLSALAWKEQKRIYWVLTGISFGFMAATKATFVISLMAWGMSLIATLLLLRNHFNLTTVRRQNWQMPLLWMLPLAVVTAVLLYTDGFKNPRAVVDFAKTFFIYETVDGHDKPFLYYLSLLLRPRGNLRQFWWEGGILILALGTIGFAYRHRNTNRHPEQRFIIPFLTVSVVLHFVIYGLIAYKTPWGILFTWIQTILLAGLLLREVEHADSRLRRWIPIVVTCVILFQGWQSMVMVRRSTSDQRVPYAYVPTSGDIKRLPGWLQDLRAVAPQHQLEPLGVLGTYYWPLPWYLRDFEQIGYWNQMDETLISLPVVFVMPDQFAAAREHLMASHVALPRGLRRDNPMMMYVRKDIWDNWMKEGS